jgi:hypothetical protein
MVAAERFVDQTIFISESARLLPGILGRCVASLLGLYFSAQHKIFHAIRLVAQERIDEQELRRSGKTDVPLHVSLQRTKLTIQRKTLTPHERTERLSAMGNGAIIEIETMDMRVDETMGSRSHRP